MPGARIFNVFRLALLAAMLSAAGPPQDAVRLSASELPGLLVGKTLETPDSPPLIVYDKNHFEYFAPDGAWSAFGGRARAGGRYRFVDDQVCVTASEATRCRWLLRDGRGQLFTETPHEGRLFREAVYISTTVP